MVYKFFDKKSSGKGIANEPNYQLENELHKPIIRKFKKRKLYSSFRDNIWDVDLADMQSLGKYNKGNKYLLCVIDLFSKYAWVVPIKDKTGTSIVNAFKKAISEWRKPNKIRVDQSSAFYNNSFKDFLKKITLSCIQHTMKENMLLLRDLLQRWKTKFLSTWQLFQKMLLLKC